MIVPMKKVSIVVLNKERRQALEQLKKIGVVHLEQLEGNGEKLAAYKEASNNAMNASAVLAEIKVPKKHGQPASLSNQEIAEKCVNIISLTEQKKRLLEEISNDSVELDRFALWGEVNPDDFAYLKEKNISLRLFEIPEDKYSLVDSSAVTISVNRAKKTVRFLLVNGGDERPAAIPPEAYEVPMPAVSTAEIARRIEDDEAKIAGIDKALLEEAIYKDMIDGFKKSLESDIQFETVYSGMGKEEDGKISDLTEDELAEAISIYKKFIAAKTAELSKELKADEALEKQYKQLKFTEDVITGRTQVIADNPEKTMNREKRRAAAKQAKKIAAKHKRGK